jgi:hypothetical protein
VSLSVIIRPGRLDTARFWTRPAPRASRVSGGIASESLIVPVGQPVS